MRWGNGKLLVRFLVAALLAASTVAARPAAGPVVVEVDGEATLLVVSASGVLPDVQVEPLRAADARPTGIRYGLYRAGDGEAVEVGVGYSHTDGHMTKHSFGTGDPGDSYVLQVQGTGTVRLIGSVSADESPVAPDDIGVFGYAVPWSGPRPLDGGYRLTLTPVSTVSEDAIGLVVYTAVRDEAAAFNHSSGHVCLEGRGATCDTTQVPLDETSVYPVTDRVTVRSATGRLGPASGEEPFSGVIDVYRPAMHGVSEYSEAILLPARVPV